MVFDIRIAVSTAVECVIFAFVLVTPKNNNMRFRLGSLLTINADMSILILDRSFKFMKFHTSSIHTWVNDNKVV